MFPVNIARFFRTSFLKNIRERLLPISLFGHIFLRLHRGYNVIFQLLAEIKRLKTLDPSKGDFTKIMAEKHRYTLQLERQLKELMSTQSDDLEKSLSSSQQSLEASNAEIEKIKIELAQVQAKLDTSQNELKQTRQNLRQSSEELITLRENFRKKELELQSDLAAVRKSNNELEVSDRFQISLPILANLSKLINFYSPSNQQKTLGFLMISGGIKVNRFA